MIKRILWSIHLVTGLLLVASAHVRLINPQTFPPAAFLGLGFMILVFLNTAFLLYWILTWNRKWIFSFLVFLLCFPTLGRYIQLTVVPSPEIKQEKKLKVMSYNVRVFDLYNWSNNKSSRDKMLGIINEEFPDVLCLQEFYNSSKPGFFTTRDTLSQMLNPVSEHIHYTAIKDLQKWGIATFSRYPIIGKGEVELPDGWNNVCIYTDIVKGDDTLRIYNVHMASVGLGADDYKIIEQINNQKEENELERTKNIITRLSKAFIKRARQAEVVKEHVSGSPYPVVLCGDFNDTPSSYTYQTLRKGLKDAFIERGSGFGVTYTKFFPAYRIDYIFTSPEIEVNQFKTIRKEYSDHFPVIGLVELP